MGTAKLLLSLVADNVLIWGGASSADVEVNGQFDDRSELASALPSDNQIDANWSMAVCPRCQVTL
jgi:hypothetical protein